MKYPNAQQIAENHADAIHNQIPFKTGTIVIGIMADGEAMLVLHSHDYSPEEEIEFTRLIHEHTRQHVHGDETGTEES